MNPMLDSTTLTQLAAGDLLVAFDFLLERLVALRTGPPQKRFEARWRSG